MAERKNAARHDVDSGARGNAGAAGRRAQSAGTAAKSTGGAGKSYNCPGEDTGYDFEELEENRI